MEYITEYLSEIQQKYNNIIAGTGSDADRLKKLKEICGEIGRQAQLYIEASEKKIDDNNMYQKKYLDDRAALYEQCKKDTALLSDLDAERIKLSAGIMNLQNEIEESRKNISDLACEQEKKKRTGTTGKQSGGQPAGFPLPTSGRESNGRMKIANIKYEYGRFRIIFHISNSRSGN